MFMEGFLLVFWRAEFQIENGWVGKNAAKVKDIGSESREIHRGVKQALLGEEPDCSTQNAAHRKPVSGAGLSFRFIAGKAEDDITVACGNAVTPCHKQGHALSSSILMRKKFIFFSFSLSLHPSSAPTWTLPADVKVKKKIVLCFGAAVALTGECQPFHEQLTAYL